MNPGQLNQQIKILVKSSTKNAMNHSVDVWTEFASTWANIKPVKAEERLVGGSEEAVIRHHIKFRYRSGVTAEMRIQQGTRVFELKGSPLNEHEKSRYLICEVEELIGL